MSQRKHELEIEIAADPSKVWEAVSTGQGIQSWFCPISSVEPGPGGSVLISWGGGMESTSRIEAWEPGQHLRTASDRAEGAPPNVVDYYVEGRGGTTVLRLVHSGFESTANFDGEFESTGGAWPLFLKIMKHSVERGVAVCRNVTAMRMLGVPSGEAWTKLTGGSLDGLAAGDNFSIRTPAGESLEGIVRHMNPKGLCGLELRPRGDLLSIFCETCGASAIVTIMWFLYDAAPGEPEARQATLDAMLDGLFGVPAAAH